jgi:hypothetical protein
MKNLQRRIVIWMIDDDREEVFEDNSKNGQFDSENKKHNKNAHTPHVCQRR